MYENNYPNDYGNKNAVDSTAKEVNTESGNFSGQTTTGNHTGYNNTDTSGYGNGNYQYNGSYGSTYNAGGGYSSMNRPPKKEKKKKEGSGFLKKALVMVSLGLFFGICAGLGFFAVESSTGMLKNNTIENANEIAGGASDTANAIAETADSTNETIDSTDDVTAVVTDVTSVVKEVMPAIVSINNTYTQSMTTYFGETMSSEAVAAGSGIIVGESDTELLIATNFHVVSDADKLTVQFTDGTEAEAQVKGSDSSMDIAVIAVSLDNVDAVTKDAIAVATLGDSDMLTVGEPAIAIGNSLGYGQSVTVGVISALDRMIDLTESGDTDSLFIQTDAAINPGNSGGALLNMKGEVIGINSNKIGDMVVEGMGYAIPISAAKPIIEDLMLKQTRAKVAEENKGYLGISQLTVVNEMAEAYDMPKGVYVSQVYEGTAAEAAGIVKGNIITEFDGNKITSSEDLIRVMEYYSEGDTVEITIMQGSPAGWESKTVTATLSGKFE